MLVYICAVTGGTVINRAGGKFVGKVNGGRGISLLEVLVVVGVISILSAILIPGLVKAKRHARRLVGRSNQRQIVHAVTLYAFDHNERFPESVATIGKDSNWNWTEPTMLTGFGGRSKGFHRSMNGYLGSYIQDIDIISCPGAPEKYKSFQEAWEAGDKWDNPETGYVNDALIGNYCFYWNYTGYLEGRSRYFKGPSSTAVRRGESKMVVSDYFGYDHWRSQKAFGSCERFKMAEITPGTVLSSSYWSRGEERVSLDSITVKLQAGFTDEHVEDYSAKDVVGMRAIIDIRTGEPYPDGIGPGVFYLPGSALH